jgi:hypothetical protein
VVLRRLSMEGLAWDVKRRKPQKEIEVKSH